MDFGLYTTTYRIGRQDFRLCLWPNSAKIYFSYSGTFHECRNLKITTIYNTKKDGGRVSFSHPKDKLVKRFYTPSLGPLVVGGGGIKLSEIISSALSSCCFSFLVLTTVHRNCRADWAAIFTESSPISVARDLPCPDRFADPTTYSTPKLNRFFGDPPPPSPVHVICEPPQSPNIAQYGNQQISDRFGSWSANQRPIWNLEVILEQGL